MKRILLQRVLCVVLGSAAALAVQAQLPATPPPAGAPQIPGQPPTPATAPTDGIPKPPSAPPEQAAPPRPTSTPYTGDLSIFETPDRDKRLQIDRVMDLLKIAPGKTVADIGAGSGWFSVRAAKRVGPGGQVLAEDINPQAIGYIRDRIAKEKLPQVHPVTGTTDDPKLPPRSVDAVLLLKAYHEIARPVPFMRRVRASLRPGALVGVIDRNGNGMDHGLNRDVLEREMHDAGYKVVDRYDFTKADGQDYFVIFTPLP